MPGAQERLFDALKKAAPHLKDYLSCALPTSESNEQGLQAWENISLAVREPSQDSNNRKEPAMQSVSLGKRNNKSLRQELAWCVVERRPV